ncbi:putative baseplate assembly protein [Ruegeria sp. MALMAid1280]|uniref:putative baseplate assembly protein n=1 Tax=Ruegeria sp. MALMAid1280 TaxID=3411634 RepID=UPI003B9DF5ED
MSIEVPQLDTIDFVALVAEARERIPRYAPDWTDHNLHDPGITLIDLVAWVADQQIYQLGFVGDAHRLAFARLLGVTPQPARPARGLLWPVSPMGEQDLPSDTRAATQENADVSCIIDLPCRLSAAEPIDLQGEVAGGSVQLLEIGPRTRASFPAAPSEDGGIEAVTIRFDRPIFRHGASGGTSAIVSLGIEIEQPALAVDATGEQVPLWAPLVFEYRAADGPWRRLRVRRDSTHGLLRSGVVALEVPAISDSVETTLRLRLDRGMFPAPPRISRMSLNALPVVQLTLHPQAALPLSTGLPDQTRALALRGCVARNGGEALPTIEVAGVDGWAVWPAVESLGRLGPSDRVANLNLDKDELCFGNGINAAIPPLGAAIRHGPYATTLGTQGNMRAGLTWRLPSQGDGVWANSAAISGGTDAWSVRQTELEARRRLRRPALDLNDETLRQRLLNLPGFAISRVEILPHRHPALPDQEMPGHRTIAIVPELFRTGDFSEQEAQRFVSEVRTLLDRNRLAGERLNVVLAQIVRVSVRAELLIDQLASPDEVEQAAELLLDHWLSPLPPANRPPPLPIGASIGRGQLAGQLAGLAQVEAVREVKLALGDHPLAATDLQLGLAQLPRSGTHEIVLRRVSGGDHDPH